MRRIGPICWSLFERAMALVILIALAPCLAPVALLLRTNTDEPVLVVDDRASADGRYLRTYQFRTTGRGTPTFRSIGHFVRSYSIDQLPGFWAVVRGWISLGEFFRLGRTE